MFIFIHLDHVIISTVHLCQRAADRRTINIELTDKGKNFLEIHENNIINAVREYMSDLKDEDLETLSHSLRNLRDILLKLQ